MAQNFREPDSITVDEYVKLFTNSKAMDLEGVDFLRAHFSFPDYTATATQLADTLNKTSFSVTNNIYGNFAKKLAQDFGWIEADKKAQCFRRWIQFLADIDNRSEIGHWLLILRPNVIEELKQIGWKND